MKRATIADVAAYAGVSKSTVSHALSGKRPISAQTRARIQEAIETLGYQPNPIAQRLAGGHTRTIAFVFPLYAPHVSGLEMQFIANAANVINQAEYAFLLITHLSHSESSLRRFVQSGLVDGFILMQMHAPDPRVELLQREGLPFVLIGRCLDNAGLNFIDLDVERAITQCVDHLVELGHRSLAYLYQDESELAFVIRAVTGFTQACHRHKLVPVMYPCEFSLEGGRTALHELLDEYPETTAVIVWNDISAWGVVQAAEARGLCIPDDLSLICFDHSTLSNLIPFKPTVVDIRADEMASRAARMLIALIEGSRLSETQVLMPPKFVIGESTALCRNGA